MGLQYFEALSPATIASIVAVLVNRLVTGNDVTGYYKYPFLTATLPSEIFSSAVVFGLYGAFVGIGYAFTTKKFKGIVHDWFHAPHDHEDHENCHDHKVQSEEAGDMEGIGEKKPLLGHTKPFDFNGDTPHPTFLQRCKNVIQRWKKCLCFVIPNEAHRAGVSGTLAGAIVGVICIFFPHVLFWGEVGPSRKREGAGLKCIRL